MTDFLRMNPQGLPNPLIVSEISLIVGVVLNEWLLFPSVNTVSLYPFLLFFFILVGIGHFYSKPIHTWDFIE